MPGAVGRATSTQAARGWAICAPHSLCRFASGGGRETDVGVKGSAGVFGVVMRWVCVLAVCALAAGASSSSGSTILTRAPGFDVRVFRFVDRTRTIRLPSGRRVPRTIETIVRYPKGGGPHPLVVFGHGYTLTPARYARLLRAWTLAGYVVAAPVFPLENANAPGGPDESDLVRRACPRRRDARRRRSRAPSVGRPTVRP